MAAKTEPSVPHCIIVPPREYCTRYERLRDELQYESRCVFCNTDFKAYEVGTLGCTFHPMLTYAKCMRGIPYTPAEKRGFCRICTNFHVPVGARRKLSEAELSRRYDCTRVDHTSDMNALFDHPVVAIPTFFATKMGLFHVSGYKPSSHPNVVLVDEPSHLLHTVVYTIPGLGVFSQRVRDIYECMCERFSLDVLEDALFEMRKGSKGTSSISTKAGVAVPGADEKFALYNDKADAVEFVPFYIIARIEQKPGEMKFM